MTDKAIYKFVLYGPNTTPPKKFAPSAPSINKPLNLGNLEGQVKIFDPVWATLRIYGADRFNYCL